MKKIAYLLILVFSVQAAAAQIVKSRSEPAFKVGEQLNYKLRYGFITAAEATLQVLDTDVKFDNKPTFHLVANGRTAGTFDFFYKVRNRYDSYIDKEDLTPYLYSEDIREASYRRSDKVRFYQDQQKIVGRKGTFKGKAQTFDLVSAYYFARNLDMSGVHPGKKITLYYFLDDEVADLQIEYIGKERVKTSMGYFNCLKFSPAIQPGRVFRKDSRLYLWITDDGNRIPVKAQVEILVGSVTMELVSAKNLKYPLNVSKK